MFQQAVTTLRNNPLVYCIGRLAHSKLPGHITRVWHEQQIEKVGIQWHLQCCLIVASMTAARAALTNAAMATV